MARTSLHHLVPPDQEPDYDQIAGAVLREIEQVLEAEQAIKLAVTEALRRGRVEAALAIMERWLVEPPVRVAAGLDKY